MGVHAQRRLTRRGGRAALLIGAATGLALLGSGGCGGGGGGGGSFSTAAGVASSQTNTAPTTTSASAGPAARTRPGQVVARHGQGFLVVDQGRRTLYTKGTSFERGEQYGYLVGDQVEGLLAQLPRFLATQAGNLAGTLFPVVTPAMANLFDPYIDADAREEMRGVVAGMHLRNPACTIRESDLVFLNSFIDLGAVLDLGSFKCSSLAVWGSLTKDGKLYQTRCIDLMVGTGLEPFALVTIAKPDGGVPYLNPSYAGMIGCPSGLNAHGLGVGQVWAFSQDRGFGRPWILITRELLASGTSAMDGVRLMQTSRRTYGSNFVFADRGDARGGAPDARAIEVSLQHTATFGPDDPFEDRAQFGGQSYAWRIPDAVLRGDCCLDPLLRSLQTASHGPSGDPRTASAYRDRYEGQATRILAHRAAGHPIERDDVIQITREVAMRRSSLQCCVYENSDLEVWVANARIDAQGAIHYAYDEPYHPYSLDYATPTASLVPDATRFPPGHTLRVAVPLTTLGRARSLDLALTLTDAAGQVHPLATTGLVLPERGALTAALQVAIPAAAAPGQGMLGLDVLEAGTQDLVDVAQVAVTVQ